MIHETFVPVNEQGVVYLFSRHHEELGFEKIMKITTPLPDVEALRNGETVWIELEYKLSGFLRHYYVDDMEYKYPHLLKLHNYEWQRDGRYVEQHYVSGGIPKKYDDPLYTLTTDELGRLILKTLKDRVDCVICWEKDCELPEDIEVIVLKDKRELEK